MPFLDWRTFGIQDVTAGTSVHPVLQTQLALGVSSERRFELLASLREVFSGAAGGELRLELPMGWTLYWKLREGDSRLLLAHPDHESWVGSVSLNPEHAGRLISQVEALSAGVTLAIGDLRHEGAWSGVSNLEVVLTVR